MVQKSRQVERRFTRDYERDHFHPRRRHDIIISSSSINNKR